MAKKLALIDPKLLLDILAQRMPPAAPIDPQLSKVTETDHALNTLLSGSEAQDPNYQLQKVNSLLTKYQTHKSKFEHSPLPPLPPPIERDESDDGLIIDTLPPTKRDTAANLLKYMRKHGISWNDSGQISILDKALEDSNITDVVHSLVRQRPTKPGANHSAHIFDYLVSKNTPVELRGSSRPVEAEPRPTLTRRTIRPRVKRVKRLLTQPWQSLD